MRTAEIGALQRRAPQLGIAQIGMHQVGILKLTALALALLEGANHGRIVCCQGGMATQCQGQHAEAEAVKTHGQRQRCWRRFNGTG